MSDAVIVTLDDCCDGMRQTTNSSCRDETCARQESDERFQFDDIKAFFVCFLCVLVPLFVPLLFFRSVSLTVIGGFSYLDKFPNVKKGSSILHAPG